jgi:hypothetical protein
MTDGKKPLLILCSLVLLILSRLPREKSYMPGNILRDFCVFWLYIYTWSSECSGCVGSNGSKSRERSSLSTITTIIGRLGAPVPITTLRHLALCWS